MKKQILIAFTGHMDLGGIERSLLGLLDSIDYEKYDVDLFIYGHHGPLFKLINPKCSLLPEVKELSYRHEGIKDKLKHGCFIAAAYRIWDIISKNPNSDNAWKKIIKQFAPKLDKEYDLAIGFFRPFDFICNNVKAKLKIGWIHTDYTVEKERTDILREDYERLDMIAAVSEECKNTFCEILPELREKIMVVENCLSKNFIEEQAREFSAKQEMPDTGAVKLLSIGRYTEAKNFDNVPDICSRLIEKGIDLKWYIIGFGADEALIKQKIAESKMEDRVILLGKKENPYPYIKECDIYVQPSRYEGKAVTVREAQMLAKPVIITKYPTSGSQLEDGVDGVIVPLDNEGCAEGIARIISDKELLDKLAKSCSRRDYSNFEETEKLMKLIKEQ